MSRIADVLQMQMQNRCRCEADRHEGQVVREGKAHRALRSSELETDAREGAASLAVRGATRGAGRLVQATLAGWRR